jgi:hypothetical protein
MNPFYRIILFSLFSITSILGVAQTEKLELLWTNETLIENGDTLTIQNCSHCALDGNHEPYIVYSFTDEIDSVWIDEVQGEFLLGYSIEGYFPLALSSKQVVSGVRSITTIKLPAYYVEDGKLKKIKSVSFSYSFKNKEEVVSTRNKKSVVFASNSKLATGTWFKLEVNKDGVYKLDGNYLSSLGVDVNSIDAKKIKIYGSGNAMLPQQNNLDRPDDLVENAIYVSSSTSFSLGDYVLFYGQSPHKIIIDTDNKKLSHKQNIYTESSYYFLTVEGGDGLRIGSQNASGTAVKTVATFDEYVYFEENTYNTLHSGRSWYAENFDNHTDKKFTLATPDRVSNTSFRYQSSVMAQAYASDVDFTISLNDNVIGVQNVSKNSVSTKGYGMTGYDKITDFDLDYSTFGNSSSFEVNVNFVGDANNNSVSYKQTHGFVDYLAIQYVRSLSTTKTQVIFRNFESLGQNLTKYVLSVSSSYSVWNITDPLSPNQVVLNTAGDDKEFTENSTNLNQYIVFKNSSYLTPTSAKQIANQNLHGITSVPNLVIVSYPDYKDAAQKLADYRESKGLSYLLVTPEQIYNEFSSGAQDITAIRDFMKMFYDRDENAFQYLLLFGSASYDYKGVIEANTNFVPTYESIESLHNVQTYASDDYYGFLIDGEGEWKETSSISDNHQLVIAVGRIPIVSNETSRKYGFVDKLINYENSKAAIGNWRQKLVFLADDGDNNLHEEDANNLADYCSEEYKAVKTEKTFLDSYEQIITEKERSPGFNLKYNQIIDDGALIINFTGHGSERALASEKMITYTGINEMTNFDKLPLYVTATCEFGRYDDPEISSGAMRLVNSDKGGSIATISTTRPVFASSNFIINEAFYEHVFQRKSDSTYLTLGESFIETKNASFSGVNNRNFSLLGDPCLKLNLPENKIILSVFDESQITENADTLKALSEVTLKGAIADGFENPLTDFEGLLYVEIFDRETESTTLGSTGSTFTYKERNSILFRGEVTVSVGEFEITFTVPKDISYGYELGKINMYAYDNDSITDAIGHYSNLLVGGTDASVELNEEAPLADLFMDDETFVYGGYTASTTLFIANLFDDNGINVTNTGIGHEITLVVDGAIEKTIVLNDFYTASVDDYKSGKVEYKFSDLSEGSHHLKLTAWDTHNNPVIEEIEFVVGTGVTFYTFPNPFFEETTLFIDHSGVGEHLIVSVTVVDDKGRIMLTEDFEYQEAPNVIDNIVWDGTFNGTEAAAGLYFMKVHLYYPTTQTLVSKIHKVVLLH